MIEDFTCVRVPPLLLETAEDRQKATAATKRRKERLKKRARNEE